MPVALVKQAYAAMKFAATRMPIATNSGSPYAGVRTSCRMFMGYTKHALAVRLWCPAETHTTEFKRRHCFANAQYWLSPLHTSPPMTTVAPGFKSLAPSPALLASFAPNVNAQAVPEPVRYSANFDGFSKTSSFAPALRVTLTTTVATSDIEGRRSHDF